MSKCPIGTLLLVAVVAAVPAAPQASAQADPFPDTTAVSTRVDWKGLFGDTLRLLALEHTVRIAAQEKTRAELHGPFWKDYHRSVRMPSTWGDGDGWLMNYVGHPGHGAAAAFTWIARDPKAPDYLRRFDQEYFATRLQATIWSALYSVQFEIGPLSEASIGNVGLKPGTTGWVDYVMTPVGAFGVMLAEDAVDRYVLAPLEPKLPDPISRAILRSVLNPSRSMAQVASGRVPWYRRNRPLN